MFPSSPRRISVSVSRSPFVPRSSTPVMIIPGVQKPHWSAWRSQNASWSGWSSPPRARPSIVVISLPSAWTASTVHDFTARPSKWIVQAPQSDVSQPIFVPVSPRSSRRKSTSSVRGSTSASCRTPLTVSAIGITSASSQTRSSSASSRLVGAKYSNCAGYTDYRLPFSPRSMLSRPCRRGYATSVAIATSYDGRVKFGSVEEVERALGAESYLPDRGLATAVYLAVTMQRPLLLEGEAGVGKNQGGKTLARVLGAELIRLQCYEGIDAAQALYEWDYARQLLYARALQAGEIDVGARVSELYGPEFLLERPLLRAIRAGSSAVLLIDELDRADDEFEAFLLEVLSEFTVTIPELGTIAAAEPPVVVVTSNRTRELHDALKRRCLYHWIDFPSLEREVEIVRLRAPEVSDALARSVADAVSRLRAFELAKPPGVAEAIDWARGLAILGVDSVDGDSARDTLGWAVKNVEDLRRAEAELFS